MTSMWRLLYNIIVVPVLWLLFHAMGLVNQKVTRALSGRIDLFERLKEKIDSLEPGYPRIWFHSSSMGEFEQAKPIIAELKKKNPALQIIVSFFSPSGCEHSQSYKFADIITYIPFDSRKNARQFLQLLRPSAAVFMRYDVWPNHLWELQRMGVPGYIANATIRQKFERSLPVVRHLQRAIYNSLDYILTVSSRDEELFRGLRLSHPVLITMGDTRYDQVWQRSNDSKSRQILPQTILTGKKILVIGSSWEEDEAILLPVCRKLHQTIPGLLMIVVPHEPTAETLERLEMQLNKSVPHIRFSELGEYRGEPVILIDTIGILMTLYRYAHVAFVGGSFRRGIHNVLEPAVYGIPVVFGPVYENSQEAVSLVRIGGAFVGTNVEEISAIMKQMLCDEAKRNEAGERGRRFVMDNVGATARFLSYLQKALEKKSENDRQ